MITKEQALGVLRHVLGAVGALLASKGVLTEEQAAEFFSAANIEMITGAVMLAVAFVSSLVSKDKKVAAAERKAVAS